MFEEKGVEAVKDFGRKTGWIEERWREKREWLERRKTELGRQ